MAFAVVAEAGCFEDGGEACVVWELVFDFYEVGDWKVVLFEESLLAEAVLGGVEDAWAGAERGVLFGFFGGGDWDVFEFKRDNIDLFCEGLDGVEIVVVSDGFLAGDLAGGGVLVR